MDRSWRRDPAEWTDLFSRHGSGHQTRGRSKRRAADLGSAICTDDRCAAWAAVYCGASGSGTLSPLNFYLISQQIFKPVAAADKMRFTFFYQHLCRLIPGIEIGGHFESVGAGIMKDEKIAFADLIDRSVPGKGIRLTNIPDNRIAF